MNNKKKIQLIVLGIIFAIILAVYLGFDYYMKHLPETTEEEAEKITVLDIDSSLVKEIGIIREGETINLQKEQEIWKCMDDESFTVDADKIQSFLDASGSITSELMIENVTDMSQYGLDEPSVSITLQWDSNLYTIKIGDQNTLADGCYYLSLNDENTVYTINSSKFYSLNKTGDDFRAVTEKTEEEEDMGQGE